MSKHTQNKFPISIGPWQKLSSECRYDNPWIQVFHEEVLSPGKQRGIYGRVHFKGQAVAILPIDESGNTYLVKQYRYTLEQDSWELPMGGCSRGESVEKTAHRELEEETGLLAKTMLKLGKYHTSNSITDEKGTAFLALDLSPGIQQLEHTETDLEVLILPFEEALQWVDEGKITDSICIAALLQAERLRLKGHVNF